MEKRGPYAFRVQRGLEWAVFETPVGVQGESTGGEAALLEEAALTYR